MGTGRRFLTDAGVERAILGGWGISSIATSRTGLPVNVTIDRANLSVPGGYNVASSERPNLISGVSLIPANGQGPNSWINPSALAIPTNGTFGNLGRNAIRGPEFWQIDAALVKKVVLTERVCLQLRAEVFNIFNRAQ